MGLFGSQFANVIEWNPTDEKILFWKWKDSEIKKGSRLIVRPGQDAIFLYNGKVEGIFRDEGSFDVESEIIPFLSSLKGFRFGFASGIRAEILFVNTREITEKWGTRNAINIPTPGLPGGMPIRAFGTFTVRISDEQVLIDRVAGIKDEFSMDEVKTRVIASLDQLLMKHIANEGKDIFHLQASADAISRGIAEDLDFEMEKIGISVTDFAIASVSYPEEIQEIAAKAASQSLIGDVGLYQQVAMADSLTTEGSAAGNMAGMGIGMAMGQQMAGTFGHGSTAQGTAGQRFCPNCGAKMYDPCGDCQEFSCDYCINRRARMGK